MNDSAPCPVTVREGREWLSQMELKGSLPQDPVPPVRAQPAVELEEVWFKYEKHAPDVIKGLSFRAYPGELTAILGGNGTGKTTTLSLLAG